MATVDSGQENYTANSLSAEDTCGGGEEHSLNYQEKVNTVKVGPPAVNAATLESLMQEQEADTTAVTVDEAAHNLPPQHHPTPTIHYMQQEQPQIVTAQPNLYSAPLQLVYVQPTPTGVNIIPIQAAGQPSFTPYSPPGFPAHPHHPVVVQPGIPFPLQYPTFYPSPYPVYTPGPYPQYPPTHPQYYQGQVPLHLVGTDAPLLPQPTSTMIPTPPYRQKFFRPWEDSSHSNTSDQSVLCPHTDCGGEGGQHSQSGGEDQQLLPYSEEDFPALTKELSRIKIKK